MKKLLILLVLICLSGSAFAEDFKTEIKSIAIFKNGLAFVVRNGEAEVKDNYVDMGQIPAILLGSYWIAGDKNPIDEVLSYKKTVDSDININNLSDIIDANIGKKVTLYGNIAGKTSVTGTILKTFEAPKDVPIPLYSSFTPPIPHNDIMMLKTDAGEILTFSKQKIESMSFKDEPNVTLKTPKDVFATKLKIRNNPKKVKISEAYLQKGYAWSPSYLVDLIDDKTAQITMDAIFANDMEDLKDVDVSFVVGYPNFIYADQISPLYLSQSVSQFVGQMSRSSMGGMGGGIAYQNAYAPVAMEMKNDADWSASNTYSSLTNVTGEQTEDLFMYKQEKVSMPKNSRIRYVLLTSKLDIEHVYSWDAPETFNIDTWGNRTGNQNREEKVWHSIKFKNPTKEPFTTAPAFIVKNNLPVAQSTLDYTPPSAPQTLKLTVASNMSAIQSYEETNRTPNVPIRNNKYIKVDVKGTIKISNWSDKAIKMNVTKNVIGQVEDKGKATATKIANDLSSINPITKLEWTEDLKAGESKDLVFTYFVYMF